MKTQQIAMTLAAFGILGAPVMVARTATGDGGQVKVHSSKVYTVRDETASMLKDIEEKAYQLHDQAVTMQAATTVPGLDRVFFDSHANAVKSDINSIGKEFAKLQALESYENSPERRVVERALPQLRRVAETAEANIKFLNEHAQEIDMPPYRDATAKLSEQTGALWQMLHDSVTLADVHKRQVELRKELARLDAQK